MVFLRQRGWVIDSTSAEQLNAGGGDFRLPGRAPAAATDAHPGTTADFPYHCRLAADIKKWGA